MLWLLQLQIQLHCHAYANIAKSSRHILRLLLASDSPHSSRIRIKVNTWRLWSEIVPYDMWVFTARPAALWAWVHQNRASPFASDFCRRRGYRRAFRSEDHFCPFSSQKNRGSLATFFAEEIAHLGASKSRAIFPGAVKIAAATAENRAILVHSALGSKKVFAQSELWGRI